MMDSRKPKLAVRLGTVIFYLSQLTTAQSTISDVVFEIGCPIAREAAIFKEKKSKNARS